MATKQRYPHETGVYKTGWPAKDGPRWFVQVRVFGRLEYHGSFTNQAEAVAVSRAVRARRDARPAPIPQPIRRSA